MELIPINDSKLKIMLDESDMKELNICDEADCANGETRHAIRTLLERAKAQIGFNTEGSEIFVQLYTSKSGGCELFVTKSSVLNPAESKEEQKNDKKGKKRETQSKKALPEECRALTVKNNSLPETKKSDRGKMIFSFDSLHDICSVCKLLRDKVPDAVSRAYTCGAETFYLILENTNMSAYSRLDPLTFIIEFGTRHKGEHLITYLHEHGKLICPEQAIQILSQF